MFSQNERKPVKSATDNADVNEEDDEAALSQLLAALSTGVRAVQGLPVGDEFAYASSFPEIHGPLSSSQESMIETISEILRAVRNEDDEDLPRVLAGNSTINFDDPLLWEQCADVCEALVEQVESYLSASINPDTTTASSMESSLQQWSTTARHKSQAIILQTQNDLPKPQVVYNMKTPHCQQFDTPAASRTQPFLPSVHPNKPFGKSPLDLSLQPGSGLFKVYPMSIITPSHHVPHVYRKEIEELRYESWQTAADKPIGKISIVKPLAATWIDTPEGLAQLSQRLRGVQIVAVDLEAHSYRSFAGFLCLMQISVYNNKNPSKDHPSSRIDNYLVDTLRLPAAMLNQHLAPVFANPEVVKVMHGADSDVQWLQRDLGIFLVNLMDTGRAARALQMTSSGYAHVLHHYTGIQADKSHQLADWRQRPLPDDMKQYAIQDTHYLLDIYHRMKWDLQESKDTSIEEVLNESKKVCLNQYLGEFFKPDGYKSIISGGGKRKGSKSRRHNELNAAQEAVLKTLWDWRDLTARAHDESVLYVCPNANLLRISLALPSTTTALQALCNPIPPLVLEGAQQILDLVKRAQVTKEADEEAEEFEDEDEEDDEEEEVPQHPRSVGTRSSAFFKPAENETSFRDDIASPVLGTEALYRQAGWTTPLVPGTGEDTGAVSTGTDEDTKDADGKPKRLLSVNPSNQDYRAKKYSEHSLGGAGQGRSADGMKSVHAAREQSRSPVNTTVDEDVSRAKQSAATVQSILTSRDESLIPLVLSMISPETDDEDDDFLHGTEGGDVDAAKGDDTDEDFPIPTSMREIYRISNRNRRNKKAGSPTPERGVTPTSEKELEELRRAEAILKERGQDAASYFESIDGSPGKRLRTRSRNGRDSEESIPEPSNTPTAEDDLAFMQEIGWIKSKEEGQKLMAERYGKGKGKGGSNEAPFGFNNAGSVGVMPPNQSANPFFAGAAMTGGPLAQGARKPVSRSKKHGKGKNQHRGQQERPEKKEGRAYAYRKR